MILGITGHRPQSIGCDFTYKHPKAIKLISAITNKFLELQPDKIISGMALGVDSYAIKAAINLDIPFIAAVPFVGQELMWPKPLQNNYQNFLLKAQEVKIVSEGGYSLSKMHIRNKWIIDNSDQLVAVWNGQESGGTYNAICFAKLKENYSIHIINSNDF
jgi:uncharacterized phage-like protein YoqJ